MKAVSYASILFVINVINNLRKEKKKKSNQKRKQEKVGLRCSSLSKIRQSSQCNGEGWESDSGKFGPRHFVR